MWSRAWVVVALGGCTFGTGVRTGAGVSRSTKPATVESPIGEPGTTVDASASQEWAQLDVLGEAGPARGLFAIGGGNSHVRFRNQQPGMQPIFAKDDNFHARLAVGFGLVTPAYHGFRLQPYGMYNNNFGSTDNSAAATKELGVDIEMVAKIGERSTSTFKLGIARIWESGGAYPDFGGNFQFYEGDYETEGWMITFGWHYGVAFEKDN